MGNKLDHGPIVHMKLKCVLKSRIAILELVPDGVIGDHGVCAQELIYLELIIIIVIFIYN